MGQASRQPMVITTAAARTLSVVSRLGTSPEKVEADLGRGLDDGGVELAGRL
jgi:hypothetical protein